MAHDIHKHKARVASAADGATFHRVYAPDGRDR